MTKKLNTRKKIGNSTAGLCVLCNLCGSILSQVIVKQISEVILPQRTQRPAVLLPIFFLIVLFSCLGSSLEASINIESVLRKASSFVDVGEYESAAQSYQNLLNEPIPEWQKTLVRYNLATAILMKGLNKEALYVYDNLPLDTVVPPLFLRSLYLNKTLGKLNLPNPDFFEALRYAKKAARANCHIFEIVTKGASCQSDTDKWTAHLQAIKLLIKQQLAAKGPEQVTNSQSQLILYAYLKNLKDDLDTFQSKYIPFLVRDKQIFEKQKEDLEPLWKLIESEKWEEADNLINRASEQFARALHDQNLIEDLLPLFKRILNQWPVQLSSLFTLDQLLKYSAEISDDPNTLDAFITSMQLIHSAITALQQSKNTEASLYVVLSLNGLQRTQFDESEIPKQTLKNIIQDQSNGLLLTRLMLDKDEAETMDPQLVKKILDVQLGTLSMVVDYYQTVFHSQKERFVNDKKCQCSPWDRVLPLVEEGRGAAEVAAEWLKQEKPSFTQVETNQKKAIDLWKKALEVQDKKSAESQDSSSNEQNKSMNKVFQLLQEMNLEDRKPAGKPQEQLGGNRPW